MKVTVTDDEGKPIFIGTTKTDIDFIKIDLGSANPGRLRCDVTQIIEEAEK